MRVRSTSGRHLAPSGPQGLVPSSSPRDTVRNDRRRNRQRRAWQNHHRAGTLGRHVRRFELLRSTGERLTCSREENSGWFRATIGGLGLTGVITWAELQLRSIAGPWLDVESIPFRNLEEFFELSEESDRKFEYTVSWIDCLARGKNLGRGLLQRANHSLENPIEFSRRGTRLNVPFVPPVSVVNAISLRLFNTVYYHRQRSKPRRTLKHFETFFFPLDRVKNWNQLYGPRGFYQYQCVIPDTIARSSTAELLAAIARSGMGSILAVLKHFGPTVSPGMLSFPTAGVTLALDFPNRGERVARLFGELDSVVAAASGRLYPAKDGRMPTRLFRNGYPRWSEFSLFSDPCCSSSFWRRVGYERQSAMAAPKPW
jgi:FAD/FMN-containing dehydrogenase